MRPGHTLLARIRQVGGVNARQLASDADTRDSVLNHLRSICFTRRGSMLTCPELGVIDVSELLHSFPDAITEMSRTLKQAIQTYEPRLANVRIQHIPTEDMTLRYSVTAQLVLESKRLPVQFETSIDASRAISVR